MINIRQFWFLFWLVSSVICLGQSFDQKINDTPLVLPTEQLAGYSSTFDFSAEKVQKAWWKYAKQFALPKNQRTHYEVTIPAQNDSRSVVIYTQTDFETDPVVFRLALKTDDMGPEEKVKYQDQARTMLLDFKRWVYLRHYEAELEKLEKSISRKGKSWDDWVAFVKKRKNILDRMKGI